MKKISLNFLSVFLIFFYTACSGQTNQEQNSRQSQGQEQQMDIDEIQQASIDRENRSSSAQGQMNPEHQFTINQNFTYAAEIATPGVVFISSTMSQQSGQGQQQQIPEFFRDFFGDQFRQQQPRPQQATGSGVIITPDGYILTNNHVVADADKLDVTLSDNRSYVAEVVGIDPTTDLALLKIDATDLNFIEFGNSDNVKVGGWVLAVGNPFGLASTVTAGIVSAKARNINIFRETAAVESFIQTDAAVNPGNSGGALVDLTGKLVGINTAIASPTGAYSGYAFAVPSDIAKKVVNDLMNYGRVQRGYLGVYIRNVDSELAQQEDLNVTQGVFIDSLVSGGAAEKAGIQKGDVVVALNGNTINSAPQLQEFIARQQPGDDLSITVIRDGERTTLEGVTLENREGGTEIVSRASESALQTLGISVRDLSDQDRQRFNVQSGVLVTEVTRGVIARSTNMQEGFIIQKVDNKNVSSVEELKSALQNKSGGVMVQGRYPTSDEPVYYGFGM